MQARGALMIEHRLIEQVVARIARTADKIEEEGVVDPLFVDVIVDFLRTYADRTHHGKEEDILFRHLAEKNLSDVDRRIMSELVQEHVAARRKTTELAEANAGYRTGDESALPVMTASLRALAHAYPSHIEKEDKRFFPASRAYFTDQEDQAMLAEFWEFDRKMIHEKYRAVVEWWEVE